MNVYRARAEQHEPRHAVWLELCTSAADSGKHANSFSYACEKVMEHPMCKRRGVWGEGQPDARGRLGGFTRKGVVGRLYLCFFCNHFLICSRGVFVGLFLRVPRRFGVHFGVVLAPFWSIFLNKSIFKNMCFVYTKQYFFRSGWVGCLNFFLRISSMLF